MGSNPTLSDFFRLPPDSPFQLRWTEESDGVFLKQWLLEPGVLRWFPMSNEAEVEDAVRYWLPNALHQNGITAIAEGQPIGLANLNRHPYRRMDHHALLSIIVGDPWKGRGVGTALMHHCLRLAAEVKNYRFLMLEVYEGNPAERLYRRVGFEEVGRQTDFLKEADGTYRSKIIMQHLLGHHHGRS